MKKKLASVAGTGNGEKILQTHMGNTGGQILRILESTMEKQKGAKAAKETRKALLRFVIKADLLYQEEKLTPAMWTALEETLLNLCQLLAGATARSREIRRRYIPVTAEVEMSSSSTLKRGKKAPPRIATGGGNSGNSGDGAALPSEPTTPPPMPQLKRTASRRAPKTSGGPPGMLNDSDVIIPPPPPNKPSLLPPAPQAPSTPVGGPPPPGMSSFGSSGGGPPGMSGEAKDSGPPGAPPSFVSTSTGGSRSRPPLPSRPTPKDFTNDDIQAIRIEVASLIAILMTTLTKNELMTSKNQTTLSQAISTVSAPEFLTILLTDKKCAEDRKETFKVCSVFADQMRTVCEKRNERLRVAAFAGDMPVILECVESGADVNSCRDDRTTPLWFAAAKGQLKAVSYLLESGANAAIADKDGALPVMLAAQEGHLDIVSLLLQPDVSGNIPDASTLATLVFIAARKGHADLLDHILQDHKQVLSVATPSGSAKAAPIELALTLAIQQGHITLVNVLLKHGCNIASAIEHGITPVLVSAAHSGSVEMTRLLIDQAGANVNAVDKAGISPLAEAAECGHTSVGKLLMDAGASVDTAGNHDGMTALLLSSQAGFGDFVDMVLAGGANVQTRDRIGSTALMLAAQQGHADMVQKLINAKSMINAVDDDGTTALFFAAQEGFTNVVKILLASGADPNLCDAHGAGPLLVAVQEGHLVIVRDLIEHDDFNSETGEVSKTNVNAPREDGITPVFTAAWLGRIKVLNLLLESGADSNPLSDHSFDDTPLCGAINRGHPEAVRVLIQHGAKVNAPPRKSDGMTPFTLAVSKCDEDDSDQSTVILQLLIEAGATAEGGGEQEYTNGNSELHRQASKAEFESMKVAAERAKERTAVAEDEKKAAELEVAAAAAAHQQEEEEEKKQAAAVEEQKNNSTTGEERRQLRVTRSVHALKKANDDLKEHRMIEAAAKNALLEQDVERHEEEVLATKKRAEEAKIAEAKAALEATEAAERALKAEMQAKAQEENAAREREVKEAAETAEKARQDAEKEKKEREMREQEAKEAEERAAEARRIQEQKEQKEREEKVRREAEEARVRAVHIALHATLKTSYYSTKKTELFQKIMGRYGNSSSENQEEGNSKQQNALRVIASFRMGSAADMKAALAAEKQQQEDKASSKKKAKKEDEALFANARVIEDANVVLERLEKCIDDIDRDAPKGSGGLHAVEGGNKMLTKALALHGLMQGEIDELQIALASNEARAAAEAEARARGMPKQLHWVNEDYQLKKELESEEIHSGLFYSPEEAAEVNEQRWMFVPNLNGAVYEPGKVFTPENEDKNTSVTIEVLTESDTVVTVNRATLKVVSIQNMDDEEGKPVTAKGLDNAQAYALTNPETLASIPNDLMKMGRVNEASVLHVLRARFKRDRFYTSVGPILISVNPFKWVDGMYSPEVIQYFVDSRFAYNAEKKRHAETPPHTFAVAERAFIALATTNASNQSILVSGESGAGKSEVAKHCLAYLAAVSMPRSKDAATGATSESRFARSKDRREEANRNMLMMGANGGGVSSAVVDSIVSAVPILEAYGNAKTVRNDNSSRFGKWLLIHFDANHSILGCSNVSYLLEKTRVVGQESGERNYHIFYYLLVGAPKKMRQELGFENTESTVPELCCQPYHYVNQSGTCVNNKSDVDKYNSIASSFTTLGFDPKTIISMHQIIASLLHLGNVTFVQHEDTSRDASAIDTNCTSALQKVTTFLGLENMDEISAALTTMELIVGGNKVQKDLLPKDAIVNRDSTSKTIYSKLFDWLVKTINMKCSDQSSEHLRTNFVGILDIFGFEIFEQNGFEQVRQARRKDKQDTKTQDAESKRREHRKKRT